MNIRSKVSLGFSVEAYDKHGTLIRRNSVDTTTWPYGFIGITSSKQDISKITFGPFKTEPSYPFCYADTVYWGGSIQIQSKH
jgi:hypothetical protein